jgi:hypothetical protein
MRLFEMSIERMQVGLSVIDPGYNPVGATGRKGLPRLLDLLIAAAESEFRIEPWARDHAAS